jgi:hypothetical protein
MTMEIPLSAIPFQRVSLVIGSQSVEIEVRQMGSSVFTSAVVDGVQITRSTRAVNGGELFPWTFPDKPAEIKWVDTQGDADPQYEGLGSRWLLVYEE